MLKRLRISTISVGCRMRKSDLSSFTAFCVITLGLSWAYWFAVIASLHGWISVPVPLTPFGAFGPAVAALIVAAGTGGREGVMELLGRLRPKGTTLLSLGIALFLWPILLSGAAVISGTTGSSPDSPVAVPWSILPVFFMEVLIFTSIGEELGWRGFGLPLLLRKSRPTVAALLIGSVWALWHLPVFWIPGTAQAELPFGYFAVAVLAASVIYTALFLLGHPSILPVLLLHTVQDMSLGVVPLVWPSAAESDAFWLAYLWILVAAAGVTAVVLARRLVPVRSDR